MRNPKQLFSLFPIFEERERERVRERGGEREKQKEKERRISQDGRDVDSIKERHHVFSGNASRFLTRLCIYRSGGKVGSKRLSPCNTPCNRIRTSFPDVLYGKLAVLSKIVSDDVARSSLCSITSVHCYCLGTGRHRGASSTRKSLPKSLNVPPRFKPEAKARGSANNLKNSTYSERVFPFMIDFDHFLR